MAMRRISPNAHADEDGEGLPNGEEGRLATLGSEATQVDRCDLVTEVCRRTAGNVEYAANSPGGCIAYELKAMRVDFPQRESAHQGASLPGKESDKPCDGVAVSGYVHQVRRQRSATR